MCCIYFQLPWTSSTWQPQILSLQLSFALGKLLLSTWEFWDTCRHQWFNDSMFYSPSLLLLSTNAIPLFSQLSLKLGQTWAKWPESQWVWATNPPNPTRAEKRPETSCSCCSSSPDWWQVKNMNCGTMKHTVIWVICHITPSPFTICPLWSPELPQLPKREPVLGCSNTFSKASVNLGETIRNLKVRELALGNPNSSHPS